MDAGGCQGGRQAAGRSRVAEGSWVFGERELRKVHAALGTAEELTSRFYCIPEREWPRFPYELATRATEPPLEDWAFADVVRVVAPSPVASRFPERYRIRLRDDAILAAVNRPGRPVGLRALLLYVLTHELVHVVRFGSGIAPYDVDPDGRGVEEARVHGITRRVLGPLRDAGVEAVARLYAGATARP